MSEEGKPPAYATFRITNWFQWIIDARKMGYSEDDVRWILRTIGIWHPKGSRIVRRVNSWEEAQP